MIAARRNGASRIHQRQRWMRPDSDRWLKPDPERWLSPEELRLEYPELYERKYGGLPQRRPVTASALDILRREEALRVRAIALIRAAQAEIAELKRAIALRRKANFNPNQPRVPAGNPDGGQWTRDGGGNGLSDPRVISDATPDNEWRPGAQYATRRVIPRGPIVIRGRLHVPTVQQATTLANLEARAEAAIARVREIDPSWRPTRSEYETIDGRIAAVRAEAEQAEARVLELQSRGLLPGPYARESIPARGPERDFYQSEIDSEQPPRRTLGLPYVRYLGAWDTKRKLDS